MACFNTDNWVRVFDIPETSKHVKGFTLYKIISIVYPKTCPDAVTKVTVWKRYNDFKKLHRELKIRHKSMQIEDKYPILPNSSFFKRFDAEVINQRKNSALSYLDYVALHPSLFKSTEFVKFFETSHTPQESLNSNINIIRAQLNLPNDPEIIYPNSDDEFGQSDSDSVSAFSVASTSNLQNEEIASLLEIRSISSHQIDSPASNITSSNSSKTSLGNNSCRNLFPTPPLTPDDVTSNEDNIPTKYLTIAAEHITKASEFECEKKYEESFTAYKSGIASLLEGVKEDKDSNRRQIVKYKIEKYLLRAEKIYNLHLSPEITQIKNICKNDNDFVAYNSIKRPIEDLFNYKVLKLMGNGMVVLHRKEHNVFYMKVVQKCLQITETKYMNIPKDVPYMVKLFQYYDSPNAIFIVTQYVSGGSLFEHINQKSLNSNNALTKFSSVTFEKDISESPERDFDDLYSDSSECSYSDLISDYTSKKTLNSQSSISKSEKVSNSDTEASSTNSPVSDNELKENSDTFSTNNHIFNDNEITASNSNDKVQITFQRTISETSYTEEFTNIHYIPPLDDVIKWAAQLLLAVDKLHKSGIVIYNLNPNKLLLDEKGNLLLSFISNFREKGKLFFNKYENNLYSAPEIFGINNVTFAADWWSYGSILFEILTGMSLKTVHPEGIYPYTILKVPKYVSPEGKSLLRQLLVYEPLERLGCGINGTDDIKSHPFFNCIDWIRLQVDAFKI